MSVRLEFVDGSASKFWELEIRGKDVITCWGRIGTAGQSKTESTASPSEASKRAEKLAADKRKEGYADAGVGAPAAKSDRAAIVAFFRGIDGREKPSYVFWHQQAERALDRKGALVADLLSPLGRRAGARRGDAGAAVHGR